MTAFANGLKQRARELTTRNVRIYATTWAWNNIGDNLANRQLLLLPPTAPARCPTEGHCGAISALLPGPDAMRARTAKPDEVETRTAKLAKDFLFATFALATPSLPIVHSRENHNRVALPNNQAQVRLCRRGTGVTCSLRLGKAIFQFS